TRDLLGQYAWDLSNAQERSWPVGSKKPNDLGLFDLHGNVWCWCQETVKNYPQSKQGATIDDNEDIVSIKSQEIRVLRGGSFGTLSSAVRSADRNFHAPAVRLSYIGFRPARTLPP